MFERSRTDHGDGEDGMTIIVGIVCREGVIIASDSQAGSFRGVHVKRLDYTKIYDFIFDGTSIAVTGAGETPFIARAIELLEEMAKEAKFHKTRDVADLAENVMTGITRRYIVERDKELGYTKSTDADRTRSQEDRSLAFSLIVGVCCGGEPCIYTVYPDGVAERGEKYASLGSGSAFAEYLLARLYRDDLTLEQAVRVAVYVVEEVKKVDLHCGGPTQIVAVQCGKVERKTEAALRRILIDLEAADGVAQDIWRSISTGAQASTPH